MATREGLTEDNPANMGVGLWLNYLSRIQADVTCLTGRGVVAKTFGKAESPPLSQKLLLSFIFRCFQGVRAPGLSALNHQNRHPKTQRPTTRSGVLLEAFALAILPRTGQYVRRRSQHKARRRSVVSPEVACCRPISVSPEIRRVQRQWSQYFISSLDSSYSHAFKKLTGRQAAPAACRVQP